MMVQQDKNPASNPDWLRKVEQAERSGDFFPEDSVIISGDTIQDPLIYDGVIVRPVYTNEDFQGIRKEPVTGTSTPKPEHPGETIRTQPGSRRIYRPSQAEIAIDQLIKQGNKAPDKSGTILRAIAAAGNIVPHIPIGVGMVGRETVEAGERFYNRSWSQRGEAALMWWEKIALAAPNLNIQSIAKANFNAYTSYLYNPEPFNSFAADGSRNGLSAQIGIGIGKNLTYGAATGAVLSPFAGGGVTTIFNGETIPWRTVTPTPISATEGPITDPSRLIPIGSKLNQTDYETFDLAKKAWDYRLGRKVWETYEGNIGVVEYVDDAGVLRTQTIKSINPTDIRARRTLGGRFGHSEDLLIQELNANGINLNRVTRIYTEYSPCEGCAQLLGTHLPNTPVYYSFEYGNSAARNQALKTLRESLGVSQKGTLYK